VLEDLREQEFLVAEKDYKLSIGKCDRCGTVIEPRLSEQWFIKIKPLAERAKAAVESGEITIVPENYRTIYLNWMTNIHDWCVSRQLYWGHQIPAWTCGACNEVVVARSAPEACAKCGGKVEQVADVLDTWFSSGLLPFTTLGWPEKTRDLEVFYPNTLLITGFDILFFWLARMIMFGCHFMQGHEQDAAIKRAGGEGDKKDDSVPFRHVYIHALVRDAERQKMSKTKGNVLDPLEVIERFGTDATRFTLAAMAAPGTDIAFNESRTEGYRAFANKIWNAARFMFMNVERLSKLRPELARFLQPEYIKVNSGNRPRKEMSSLRFEDVWIRSRFHRAAQDINDSLQTYRFHEAANRLYDFFWGDFCDWYIELIKPRLNVEFGTDAYEACENLMTVFEASLRLLHPIMPFISEEIWQAIYEGKAPEKSIALAGYPKADEKQIDSVIETKMLVLQDLIVSIRNLRAELKVETKEKVPVEVFSHDPEMWNLIQNNREAIERLANVDKITEASQAQATKAPSRSTARFDVRVIYEQKIDVGAECGRLKKELEKIEKGIASGQRQLGNDQFLGKAPANVVEGLRKQHEELVILQEKTLGKLRELGCGGSGQ
jgi:valyl-tRNA synthetase